MFKLELIKAIISTHYFSSIYMLHLKEKKYMKNKKQTFTTTIEKFGFKRDIRTVFADFLTLSICAFSQNPKTKLSNYEDEYLSIMNTYDKPADTNLFPELLATLILEMKEKMNLNPGVGDTAESESIIH